MLHAIQLDRGKYSKLLRDNREATAEDRKTMLRSCQTVVQLSDEEVRLVSEYKCPEPAFREITNTGERLQKLRNIVRVDPAMLDMEKFPQRSEAVFTIRVYERLALARQGVPQRYTPQILDAEGKQIIRHFFTRSPAVNGSEDHVALRFARRAIAYWMLTGQWPKKQGITIGEQ